VADFERRGIPLIIEAARGCPDVEFVLLWRRWGDVDRSTSAFDALCPPGNVRLDIRDVADMSAVYAGVHATIFVPADGHGKSCPNSVVEGLACGKPALLDQACGIARLVERSGAGVALGERTPAAVSDAVRRLQREYPAFSSQARALAELTFSEAQFVAHYRELYADLFERAGRLRRRDAAARHAPPVAERTSPRGGPAVEPIAPGATAPARRLTTV
jgi:glycosyltransferase involved in cell wall biosynthesis